ncbi:MAG: glycosyltransferase family 4 protein [Rikenellaceae bacterium]
MQAKNFVLISPKNRTAHNFRGELISEIIKLGYTVYVTGPNQIDVDKIEQLGAKFIEIPNDKNGVNVLSDIKYLLNLISIFNTLKPEATLGYTVKPVIYGAIAARICRVKSITSMITGVGYLFISKSLRAKILKSIVLCLYKIGLASAHKVIFQNPDDRDEFVSNKLVSAAKTAIVNGSGVNMTKFSVEPYPEKLTFFMLSRVMHSKGVVEYATAAKVVKQKYPEVRFMLLGAFEGIQDSINEVDFRREYVDSGVIDYFGESDNIPSYYAQASVYVLPSYREGTPRTVLEAMSMGRAVITTDVPGCRETVIDGESGYLVAPRDVESLVVAMQRFIDDRSLPQSMGAKSHKYCYDKYRVEVVNESMIANMSIK